jgi:peroxiredoxin
MWLASYLVLLTVVAVLGFLLLGTLRVLSRLMWRVEQLEAMTPARLEHSGLKLGRKAPDFSCLSVQGGEVRLHDLPADKVLLVFLQIACKPCEGIIKELNHLHGRGTAHVIAVQRGTAERIEKWVEQVGARFPVLIQVDRELARRYQVLATPFAFILDRQKFIVSKGFVAKKEHLHFVLEDNRSQSSNDIERQLSLKEEKV